MTGVSRHDIETLRRSGLFDERWYLAEYPDVKALGMDAAEHYLWIGAKLKRQPAREATAGLPAPAGGTSAPARDHARLVAGIDDYGAYFDEKFYSAQVDVQHASRDESLQHYLNIGWKDGKDPSSLFSTNYYLDQNADIKNAKINPLHHYVRYGRSEGRSALPYRERLLSRPYYPTISAIIPNYNHAKFLVKRIESILAQKYEKLNIIILDDMSTDDSLSIIRDYVGRYPGTINYMQSDERSGNVFKQWRKGIEATDSDLIWICESDDFCDDGFLDRIVPEFADQSNMIVFGRVQFCDASGTKLEGLDQYREQARSGIWEAKYTAGSAEWFRTGFGVSNLIPNVGGCVIRNQPIPDNIWQEAEKFRILGDWYLYLKLAQGGRMTYVPGAISYFRQHGQNTSVKSFLTGDYYREHQSMMVALRKSWATPLSRMRQFYAKVRAEYERVDAAARIDPLERYIDPDEAIATPRDRKHILLGILGFSLGGGELFPISLANALVEEGQVVSLLVLRDDNENDNIRRLLDKRVAVFYAQMVADEFENINDFMDDIGVDIVHTHNIDVDQFLIRDRRISADIPYIVTNHGSYECTNLASEQVERLSKAVTHWVYLSDKNLRHLSRLPAAARTHIPNGVPASRHKVVARDELRIPDSAIVFTIASRAIPEKGWHIAIAATERLRGKYPHSDIHLVLCGEGPEVARLSAASKSEHIHFLGFRPDVAAIYEISDCAMLPSRFAGESFPLTLIEAQQAALPIIATDIGEIRSMVERDGAAAGLVIPWTEDDDDFVDAVVEAMERMLDPALRSTCSTLAARFGAQYSMHDAAKKYIDVYDACHRPAVAETIET